MRQVLVTVGELKYSILYFQSSRKFLTNIELEEEVINVNKPKVAQPQTRIPNRAENIQSSLHPRMEHSEFHVDVLLKAQESRCRRQMSETQALCFENKEQDALPVRTQFNTDEYSSVGARLRVRLHRRSRDTFPPWRPLLDQALAIYP